MEVSQSGRVLFPQVGFAFGTFLGCRYPSNCGETLVKVNGLKSVEASVFLYFSDELKCEDLRGGENGPFRGGDDWGGPGHGGGP